MKQHRGLRIAAIALAVIAGTMILINLVPPRESVAHNPFRVGEGRLPMIAAHRGGSLCNPENTVRAFREAVYSYGVEIIESDLYLTADGYLVCSHDAYIDESCDIRGDLSLQQVRVLCREEANRHYIRDMTLQQLQDYNFGYYFTDTAGERIYRDAEDPAELGLQIATVEGLLAEFGASHPGLLFILEIKDGGERGAEACRALNAALSAYPQYRSRTVVGSFHGEVEQLLQEQYPDLLRGASVGTAARFLITTALGVDLFDPGGFACLQIPMEYDLGVRVALDHRLFIDSAHDRNIAVQYWTVNDAGQMRRLIELGCDAIMTDDPALLRRVLEEYR